jgi:hypothetical protein
MAVKKSSQVYLTVKQSKTLELNLINPYSISGDILKLSGYQDTWKLPRMYHVTRELGCVTVCDM